MRPDPNQPIITPEQLPFLLSAILDEPDLAGDADMIFASKGPWWYGHPSENELFTCAGDHPLPLPHPDAIGPLSSLLPQPPFALATLASAVLAFRPTAAAANIWHTPQGWRVGGPYGTPLLQTTYADLTLPPAGRYIGPLFRRGYAARADPQSQRPAAAAADHATPRLDDDPDNLADDLAITADPMPASPTELANPAPPYPPFFAGLHPPRPPVPPPPPPAPADHRPPLHLHSRPHSSPRRPLPQTASTMAAA